jgi:NAD-dependent SIR2 family protein deacetylase
MRISIPTVKLDTLARSIPPLSLEAAIERLAGFLQPGKAAVLTGAGMSVDSGIRAYRGEFGRCAAERRNVVTLSAYAADVDSSSSIFAV